MNSTCTRLLLAAMTLLPLAAAAQRDGVDVSLSRIDSSLPCAEAGAQVQVHFDVLHAAARPRTVRLLLNGVPVPSDQVRNAWPHVTLLGGLAEGRNTVELRAETADGRVIHRSQVVKVGDSVHSADGVTLACRAPAVVAEAPAPATVVESAPTVVYSTPPPVYYGDPYYPVYAPYYGGYYGWGGPAITLGFGGCFGCYRHGGWDDDWHHDWRGGWHGGWRH